MYNFLFLGARKGEDLLLKKILDSKNYDFKFEKHEDLDDSSYLSKFDMIFFFNLLEEKLGYQVYSKYKNYLLEYQIPFLLVNHRNCQKSDIFLALELGVDNIIFFPFDHSSIFNKISHILNKKEKFNFFHSKGYQLFFDNSSYPKMLVNKDYVEKVNTAFLKHSTLENEKKIIGERFEVLFDLENFEENQLNFDRLSNGLAIYSRLKNVFFIPTGKCFDLTIIKVSSSSDVFIAELHPVLASNKVKHSDLLFLNNNSTENRLTQREQQIIFLSAKGLPLKIIAENLDLSQRTVERHRANIMKKAGARNILEAILHYTEGNLT